MKPYRALCAALILAAGRAAAAEPVAYTAADGVNAVPVTQAAPLPTVQQAGASTATGIAVAATITGASTQVLAAAPRRKLSIDNESATATIACAFGAAAAINAAGSYTLTPGQTRVWSAYPVPADALNCISNAGPSPATIEAN
jgi:hypothetical protein